MPECRTRVFLLWINRSPSDQVFSNLHGRNLDIAKILDKHWLRNVSKIAKLLEI
jgi:hypothetical protein